MTKFLTKILLFAALMPIYVYGSNALNPRCARAITDLISAEYATADYSKPTVVLLDAYYSSGTLPAPIFIKEGVQVVHVYSHGEPHKPEYENSLHKSDFVLDLRHRGNIEETLNALKPFQNIIGVLPASDPAVLVASELAFALKNARFPNLPANKPHDGLKDKYLQHEISKKQGIDSALQTLVKNESEAIKWVDKNGLLSNGPKKVVVKPRRSAGAEDVFICHDNAEIIAAVKTIRTKKDKYGNQNSEVLVQEFLSGIEYVVDTTSLNGKHVVSDILQYIKQLNKDGTRQMYDYDLLLDYEGAIQQQLVDYTLKVLNALGVENGNAHTEVMMVPGRGPVLVEMNNRIIGTSIPILVKEAIGRSQIELTVMALQHPDKFMKLPQGYKLIKHGASVTLTNHSEGTFLNPDIANLLAQTKGYMRHSLNYKYMQPMAQTVDLGTAMGDVFVIDPDPEALLKSIEKIRTLERQGHLVTTTVGQPSTQNETSLPQASP